MSFLKLKNEHHHGFYLKMVLLRGMIKSNEPCRV